MQSYGSCEVNNPFIAIDKQVEEGWGENAEKRS